MVAMSSLTPHTRLFNHIGNPNAMLRLRLRELGRTRGWTLVDIAHLIGVEYQTVSYWNQGRAVPRLGVFLQLLKLFNCTVDELVSDLETPKPNDHFH
jgi:transcriptional regulator with XRE-family HTH domain